MVLMPFVSPLEIIEGGEEETSTTDTIDASTSTSHIPWHISNKYYDADVNFRLSTISLFDSSTVKRPTRIRRAAQMVTSSENASDSISPENDDEELKRRVRNVFEALEKPGSFSRPKDEAIGLEEGKMASLAEEIQGVDAVMMVIDASQVRAVKEML
jgi:hypothetical protein